MFTGITEAQGKITAIEKTPNGARLSLIAADVIDGTKCGDSIAINGVCLTVTSLIGEKLTFDAVNETLKRSTLGTLRAGETVNLERALTVGSRLGGHFLSGHVDAVGRIAAITRKPGEVAFTVSVPRELMRYITAKGSIALDGISLTVAKAEGETFSVYIIPHTLAITTLGACRVGDALNVEVDLLARYVVDGANRGDSRGRVTLKTLQDNGFM